MFVRIALLLVFLHWNSANLMTVFRDLMLVLEVVRSVRGNHTLSSVVIGMSSLITRHFTDFYLISQETEIDKKSEWMELFKDLNRSWRRSNMHWIYDGNTVLKGGGENRRTWKIRVSLTMLNVRNNVFALTNPGPTEALYSQIWYPMIHIVSLN